MGAGGGGRMSPSANARLVGGTGQTLGPPLAVGSSPSCPSRGGTLPAREWGSGCRARGRGRCRGGCQRKHGEYGEKGAEGDSSLLSLGLWALGQWNLNRSGFVKHPSVRIDVIPDVKFQIVQKFME